MNSAQEIIKKLDLKPHPEGGFFKETYRSVGEIKENCLDANYEGTRNFSTCIYFLLTSNQFSAFHRIKQDEIWHFYKGSTIRLHIISEAGKYTHQLIGCDFLNGEVPQYIVRGGAWFAAEVVKKDSYSLVGCTVAPGFSFDDFELILRKELVSLFPHLEDIIVKLSHP